MKKALSLILALVMIIGILPMATLAAEDEIIDLEVVMRRPLQLCVDAYESMHSPYPSHDVRYYYEWSEYADYTVTYKSGKKTTVGDAYALQKVTGIEVTTLDDQGTTNWGVGTHEGTVEFAGLVRKVKVEIVGNGIKSIRVKVKQPLRMGIDGLNVRNDTGVNFLFDWWTFAEYTINYENGNTVVCNYDELFDTISYDRFYHFDDQYNNPWEVGKHSGVIVIDDYNYQVDVEIVKSDVASISGSPTRAVDAELDIGDDVSNIHSNDNGFRPNDFFNEFTITYKDGKTFTGDYKAFIENFGRVPQVTLLDTCKCGGKIIGKHDVVVEFGGVEYKTQIEIAKNVVKPLYTAIKLFENDDKSLSMTLTKNDGSKITAKILNYDYMNIYTDKGTFEGYMSYSDDAQVTIGKVTSNIIKDCQWQHFFDAGQNFYLYNYVESFDGKMTKENLLSFIDFYYYESYGEFDFYENGQYYQYGDKDSIKNVLSEYFVITDKDMSLLDTNPKTGEVIFRSRYHARGGWGDAWGNDVDYWPYFNDAKDNGTRVAFDKNTSTWTYTSKEVTIKWNNKGQYLSWGSIQAGDANGDGSITAVDARYILQAVAGIVTFSDQQKANCDLNNDGKVSAVDARILLQAVAGLTTL